MAAATMSSKRTFASMDDSGSSRGHAVRESKVQKPHDTEIIRNKSMNSERQIDDTDEQGGLAPWLR